MIAKLSSSQRGTDFFRDQCRVPDEVIHEAGAEGTAELDDVRYPTTPTVLRALQTVMATIEPRDIKLVDLYRNKGNADPFLVACALVEQQLAAQMLLGPQWVVVTDDNAVRGTSDGFGVEWCSLEAFVAMAFPQALTVAAGRADSLAEKTRKQRTQRCAALPKQPPPLLSLGIAAFALAGCAGGTTSAEPAPAPDTTVAVEAPEAPAVADHRSLMVCL